jgi:transcriptional regulator with GAF, ATPase, and Fis domain
MTPSVQAKLLRVLQEREFQRVGGTVTLRTDARVIAATNRDLEQAVVTGRLREDLFYRLNVFTVHLPPLRERGDDVLLLADHFVRALGFRMGKGEAGLSRDAREALLAHRWPGNIRELQNAVERALIVSDGGLIASAELGIVARAPADADRSASRLGRRRPCRPPRRSPNRSAGWLRMRSRRRAATSRAPPKPSDSPGRSSTRA